MFDYSFFSNAEGLLSVFVDNQVVYKADQRFTEDGINSSKEIGIGEVQPGIHSLSFRLDPFTDVQSIIEISNIQTGVLTLVDNEHIDIMFNWAETTYPQYFPTHSISSNVGGYYARYYAKTDNYLGTKDGRVYVYGDEFNGLLDVGSLTMLLTLADNARIDALLDWVEANYPQSFPPHSVSANVEGYYARYYVETDNYLGIKDGRVYVYGDEFNGLLDVGSLNEWFHNLGL